MKKNLKLIITSIVLVFIFGIIVVIKEKDNNITLQANANVNVANDKIEWGIKRGSNHGQPDLGKKNKELIEKYNGMAMGNNKDKYIYLTFDLGYEAGYTSKILDVLKENNVKATFFVTAHYVNSAEDILKRMIDEGHIVRKPYS